MKKLMIIAVALMLPHLAQATAFQSEWNKYCNKVKECTMEQMGQNADEIPQAMRDMVMKSMEGMCSAMEEKFTEAKQAEYSDIADAGAECLRSLNSMSCAQMTQGDGQQLQTEECREYQELAESHSANQ